MNERLDEKGYNFFPRKYFDLSEVRKFIVDPAGFTHLGAIETKISLANGVAKRDPTRDKRVIEFCLRVPGEQYVKMGEERSLIRRGMEGILPDEIRLNTLRRGIQSADWVQRIIPQWDNIIEQLQSMINDKNTSKYLDVEKLRKAMPPKGRLPDWEHRYLIRMLLISLIFTRFLDIHNPSNK